MSSMRVDIAPKRAWVIIFPIVFALCLLSSGLLMMLLDFSLVAALAVGLLLFVIFFFLVRSGYYVQVPSMQEMQRLQTVDEIGEMANMLCLERRDSPEETKSTILRFVTLARGKKRIWVAPRGLLRLLRRIRAVPEQEEALRKATKCRVVRRIVVTKRLKRVEE